MMKRFTVTQERAAHRIAVQISKILCTYVDPYTLNIWPARGYWTHTHQDVQRFTGSFPNPELPKLRYSFGSWDLTVSKIAGGCKMKIHDERGKRQADNDFQIEAE